MTVDIWLEKQYSWRPSFFAVMDAVPCDCFMCFARAVLSGSASYAGEAADGSSGGHGTRYKWTYPKVNVEVPATTDLVRDGHLGYSQWHVYREELSRRTLSFTWRSSKKHSFLAAGTSIMCAEASSGNTSRAASHIMDSVGVYGRAMVVGSGRTVCLALCGLRKFHAATRAAVSVTWVKMRPRTP